MQRARTSTAALATALATALWTIPAQATVRPDPLEPKPGCEKWHGQAGGNDPTVELDVQLCPGPNGVTGETQWSSLRSGWSVRAIEGSWSADDRTLTLRDLRFSESKPNPGWRFCLIDRYELKRAGSEELTGSYRSSACDDSAWVKLKRMPSPPPPPSSSASPPGEPPSAAPPAPSPAPTHSTHQPSSDSPPDAGKPGEEPRGKGCGACATALGRESGGELLDAVLVPALLLLGIGRRRGSRR